MAAGRMIFPRNLDGAFAGLGARVAEEDAVSEGIGYQTLGQALLVLDAIKVRRVPELVGLLGQGCDELGVAVAKAVHGDAAGEV